MLRFCTFRRRSIGRVDIAPLIAGQVCEHVAEIYPITLKKGGAEGPARFSVIAPPGDGGDGGCGCGSSRWKTGGC